MKLRTYLETTLSEHLANTATRNLYGTEIFCGGRRAVKLADRYTNATDRAWASTDGLNEMARQAAKSAMGDLFFSEWEDTERDGDLHDEDALSDDAFMAACNACSNADGMEQIGSYWWFNWSELQSAMGEAADAVVANWKNKHHETHTDSDP